MLQVGVVFIPCSSWEGSGSMGLAVSTTHTRFTGPSPHENVQIPSCGSKVLCYHSHPAPGAFGMVVLSAAPQRYAVHPTQRVYKHADHSLEWTRRCSIRFPFQWLRSSKRQQGCVYLGSYFTHQDPLQIFKLFLPEDWGRT